MVIIRALLLTILSLFTLTAATEVKLMSQEELLNKQTHNQPLLILDVRTPQEYSQGHVPGAINIPHTVITANEKVIKRESEGKQIVVYCHSGRRAGYAEKVLQQLGFDPLYHLDGDMIGWKANNRPIEK